LMEEIIGDEMNSLLTLARILVTLDTGQIVSKDAAADMIAPTLNDADRALMELARDVYLGNAPDSWTGYEEGVLDLVLLQTRVFDENGGSGTSVALHTNK